MPLINSIDRLTTALSAEWLEHAGVLPLRLEQGALDVGVWRDDIDPHALDDLRVMFGAPVVMHRYAEHDVRSAIRRLYAQDAVTAEGLIAGLSGEGRASSDAEIPLDDLLHDRDELRRGLLRDRRTYNLTGNGRSNTVTDHRPDHARAQQLTAVGDRARRRNHLQRRHADLIAHRH